MACAGFAEVYKPTKVDPLPVASLQIQRRHNYRDFHEQPQHFRPVRRLYTRAWVSAERPMGQPEIVAIWLFGSNAWGCIA